MDDLSDGQPWQLETDVHGATQFFEGDERLLRPSLLKDVSLSSAETFLTDVSLSSAETFHVSDDSATGRAHLMELPWDEAPGFCAFMPATSFMASQQGRLEEIDTSGENLASRCTCGLQATPGRQPFSPCLEEWAAPKEAHLIGLDELACNRTSSCRSLDVCSEKTAEQTPPVDYNVDFSFFQNFDSEAGSSRSSRPLQRDQRVLESSQPNPHNECRSGLEIERLMELLFDTWQQPRLPAGFCSMEADSQEVAEHISSRHVLSDGARDDQGPREPGCALEEDDELTNLADTGGDDDRYLDEPL